MFRIKMHRQVSKFLESLDRKRQLLCKRAIDELANDPFRKRPGCDIKKMSGKQDAYRLRVGSIRFNYVVYKDKVIVYIEETFKRGMGYRKGI